MEDFFKELIAVYKTHVRVKQIKRKAIENFCLFYASFMDEHKDPKQNKDKYLQLKRIGLQYILNNKDLIYSEINR